MNERESNVVSWPHVTVAPMTPEKILTRALKAGVEPLITVGYDRDGKLYVAGTHSEVADIMVLLRLALRYFEDTCWKIAAPDDAA